MRQPTVTALRFFAAAFVALCVACQSPQTPADSAADSPLDAAPFDATVIMTDADSAIVQLVDVVSRVDVTANLCETSVAVGIAHNEEVARSADPAAVDLELSPSGGAMIAYQRSTDRRIVISAQWNNQWPQHVLEEGAFARLGLEAEGRPHLVYVSGDGHRIRFARWTGLDWRFLTLDRGSFAENLVHAVDGNNRSHVAWTDTVTHLTYYALIVLDRIEVLEQVGEVAPVASLSLRVKSNGSPQIAWYEGERASTGGAVRHAVRIGNGWRATTVATTSPLAATTPYVQVAISPGSERFAVYYVDTLGGQIARFDGVRWSSTRVQNAGVEPNTVNMQFDVCDRVHLLGSLAMGMGALAPRAVRYLRERLGAGTFDEFTLLEGGMGPGASHGAAIAFVLASDQRPAAASVSRSGVVEYINYEPQIPPDSEALIRAATGGVVEGIGSSARLTVPPGALAADTTVGVGRSVRPAVDAVQSAPVTRIFQLTPSGTVFSTPARLRLAIPYEATWNWAGPRGLALFGGRVKSGLSPLETVPSTVQLDLETGVLAGINSIAHFSDSWLAIHDLARTQYASAQVNLAAPHEVLVGRRFTAELRVTNPSPVSVTYASIEHSIVTRSGLTLTNGVEQAGQTVERRQMVVAASMSTENLQSTFVCQNAMAVREVINAQVVLGANTFSAFSPVRCVQPPSCLDPAGILGSANVLSMAALGDDRACTAALISQTIDTAILSPESPSNPLIDRGAKDDAHFEAVGARLIDLDAAAAATLTTAMSCGIAPGTRTVCQGVPTPFTAGRYFVATAVMQSTVVIDEEDRDYVLTAMLETDGVAANNWTGTAGRTQNFENGTDTWYSFVDNRGESPTMVARRVTGAATSAPLASQARISVRGNAVLFVVPASETGLSPQFGFFAMRHQNLGAAPEYDASFDCEPPVPARTLLRPR